MGIFFSFSTFASYLPFLTHHKVKWALWVLMGQFRTQKFLVIRKKNTFDKIIFNIYKNNKNTYYGSKVLFLSVIWKKKTIWTNFINCYILCFTEIRDNL